MSHVLQDLGGVGLDAFEARDHTAVHVADRLHPLAVLVVLGAFQQALLQRLDLVHRRLLALHETGHAVLVPKETPRAERQEPTGP